MSQKATVSDLHQHYLKVHAPKQQEKTTKEYARIWRNYILPPLGTKILSDVTERDCVELYHSLHKTPVQANRVIAILKAAFNLAEDWAMIPRNSNPVHVKLEMEEPRDRYPDNNEAKLLFGALNKTMKSDPIFACYVWLLMLTGARPGEIRKAKREWISQDNLCLPTAKRRKKGRVVTLSSAAKKMIEQVPKKEQNPYLIPGKDGDALKNPHLKWHKLLSVAGITGLQMRDLRRYFASLALSDGITLDNVGQLLGHTQSQTTRRYAYLMTEARMEGVEAAAKKLESIKNST